MEDSKAPSYAHGPPWSFKGSALYQLHLVKAETARAFIPRELKLVEAFGYTLGGFFLAQYEDSPAGKFDELVVIAGTVWNPPTSCAWATRVLVNSHEACEHGRKHVGLPSQVATFLKRTERISDEPRDKWGDLLNIFHRHYSFHKPKDSMEIEVSDTKGSTMTTFCNINMSSPLLNSKTNTMWMPMLRLSLPSFSGHTEYHPDLLKYSCQIECRVQAVKPAKISGPSSALKNDGQSSKGQLSGVNGFDAKPSIEEDARECSISVMQSKPILALKFNLLQMQVEAPTMVSTN